MSTFWSANTMEPKRAFRWVADINLQTEDGNEVGPSRFLISTFTKPHLVLAHKTIINGISSGKSIMATNYAWNDISISMIDVENKKLNASRALYGWLRSLGYGVKGKSLFEKLGDKERPKMNITLEHLNADGIAIERWTFLEPQPTEIDFGGGTELSYGSDEVMTVRMGIAYVAAEYEDLSTRDGDRGGHPRR